LEKEDYGTLAGIEILVTNDSFLFSTMEERNKKHSYSYVLT
jgi:hypothetical protein